MYTSSCLIHKTPLLGDRISTVIFYIRKLRLLKISDLRSHSESELGLEPTSLGPLTSPYILLSSFSNIKCFCFDFDYFWTHILPFVFGVEH